LSSCYSGGGGVTRDDTCHPPALAIGPTIACWCHRQLTVANPPGEELELDLVQMPPWRHVVGHGRPDLPARAHHFGVHVGLLARWRCPQEAPTSWSLWTFLHGQPRTIATGSGGTTLGFWVDESRDMNGDITSTLKRPTRVSDINRDAR
jgi:hypothetical protein